MNKDLEIQKLAIKLRNKSLRMALDTGKNGAHLGGGLSAVEIFATLYGGILKFDISNPADKNRDRLIVSKGHCVLSYYGILYEVGFLTEEDLNSFENNDSEFHGHATRNISKGIEFSGGSLGMGMSYAVGIALAGKINKLPYQVYVIIGDGECDEGIVWESFMSAAHYSLNNLTVIIDNNKLQYDGESRTVMNLGNLKEKLESFGLSTIEVDGHCVSELYAALLEKHPEKPKVIIADTIKGKGVSFMENRREWHHSTLTKEQYDLAVSEQPILE